MTVEYFSYEGAGIQNVYQNDKWLIAIKNWRLANDVEHISRLEVHFKTDEQFILLSGSAVLLYAEHLDASSEIHVQPLEPGKVFQVPQGLWFNNVLSRDAKLVYIEAADTKAAPDNSIYQELTQTQIDVVRSKVRAAL